MVSALSASRLREPVQATADSSWALIRAAHGRAGRRPEGSTCRGLHPSEFSDLLQSGSPGSASSTATATRSPRARSANFRERSAPFVSRHLHDDERASQSQAEEQATSPGYKPIDLIDGERLIDLLLDHDLGIKQTIVVDEDFLRPFSLSYSVVPDGQSRCQCSCSSP